MAMPFMREWISQAILEHEDFDELDMDFQLGSNQVGSLSFF